MPDYNDYEPNFADFLKDKIAKEVALPDTNTALDAFYQFIMSWDSPDDVFVWVNDVTGGGWQTVYVNDKVVDWFNYSRQDWYDAPVSLQTYHSEDASMIQSVFSASLDVPYNARIKKSESLPDASAQWFSVQGVSLRLQIENEPKTYRVTLAWQI